jgi:tetratricopeptide (TPR) repeat protein
MNELEPPDSHYAQAAQGWLELGNLTEAAAELAKISEPQRNHPEVLSVHWNIYASEKKWEAGVAVANQIVETAPDYPFGWIHRSYALHELKRTQEAFDQLLPAVSRFPKLSLIPYNLSCYCCQLCKFEESMIWFQKALLLGDPKQIKQMALEDPDLQPLKSEISKISKSIH